MITRIDKDLTLSPPVNNHSNTARELDIDSIEKCYFMLLCFSFLCLNLNVCKNNRLYYCIDIV